MRPRVTFLREIDTSEHIWCDAAVLFSVRGGRGTLTHRIGEAENDRLYPSQLMLNGRPIMQGKYAICPTCMGLLSVGYGTDAAACPEFAAVRDCLNAGYTGLQDALAMLSPLLGLLDDGYYLLADVPHMPTDGDGHFFYSVPNALTPFTGACNMLYHSDFLTAMDSVPACLYPTQPAELIREERVAYYTELLQQQPHAVRGLAYHEIGCFSALLDGHHKACAAARLGMRLSCLTILPADSCRTGNTFRRDKERTPIFSLCFSEIEVPAPAGMTYGDFLRSRPKPTAVTLKPSTLTGQPFPVEAQNAARCYPTLRTWSVLLAGEVDPDAVTEEELSRWLCDPEDGNYERLCACLSYWEQQDPGRAFALAAWIIRLERSELPLRQAWQIIVNAPSPESEALVIGYLVEHDKSDQCWDIVTSYWE